MELPGLRRSDRGSILAACVECRRYSVSGRQLSADPLGRIEFEMTVDLSWLIGRQCSAVHRDEFSWRFVFDGAAVTTPCPWRLIEAGRIKITSEDHGHQFGLPAPVDARREAESVLVPRAIGSVSVREETGDLNLGFSGNVTLELLQTSAGYESWSLVSSDGHHVIATGGGELALWNE